MAGRKLHSGTGGEEWTGTTWTLSSVSTAQRWPKKKWGLARTVAVAGETPSLHSEILNCKKVILRTFGSTQEKSVFI